MLTPFSTRRRALRKLLAGVHLDALLVDRPANWYYLTGFTGEAGALLITPSETVLVTDGRFTVQGKEETAGVRIEQQRGSLYASVGELLKRLRGKRVGYDAAHLTVSQWKIARKAAGARWRWVAAQGMVERLRMRKEHSELAVMRKAAILASDVMRQAIKLLKPGVREVEIAAEIDYRMREGGGSGPAFETIVAFGERAALPHARPTAKRLKKNELVVLDLGAILGHYCSDMTRTVFVGRAPSRVKAWYQAVQAAQESAVNAVRAGITCGEIDSAARSVLTKQGLESYFVHSTGHGLGLEVHEDPRLARGQQQKLEPGNVVTIEPGVYVAGTGGIRIEDDVVVHPDGNEILTRVSRDLIEL